ncbi:MAG: hypothetical protein WBQ37_00970 [Candidatus Competibacter sp.]
MLKLTPIIQCLSCARESVLAHSQWPTAAEMRCAHCGSYGWRTTPSGTGPFAPASGAFRPPHASL